MKKTETGLDKEKIIKILYWLTPLLVFIFQLIFTLNSTNQIRYEELAESVRNVFWLQNRTIYDGVSSNVGWYGTLLFIYNLFGFSINNAKFFRLFLQLISLLCLASVLKNYLGLKKAWVPLIAIGLSPTLLYLNTLQTSYGTDLQYLPICLYLVLTINADKKWISRLKQILFGALTMIAWMSYPTFIFYFPVLWGIYFWNLFSLNNRKIYPVIKKSFLCIFSFILPLLTAFIYVQDRNLLLNDPLVKSGIFRGAGTFNLNLNVFTQNITRLFSDLFIKGASYNFELYNTEFANYFPALTLLLVLSLIIYLLIKNKENRGIVLLISFIFLFNLVAANFNSDPSTQPGIRRNTAILASVYAFYIVAWNFIFDKKWKKPLLKNIIILIFLLLPLHHIMAYSPNLEQLKKPSLYQYPLWFNASDNPSNSLNQFLTVIEQKDFPLSYVDKSGQPVYTRYSEIYAAIKGACYWNKLQCKELYGYDPKTKKFIPLSIDLWRNYYWEH